MNSLALITLSLALEGVGAQFQPCAKPEQFRPEKVAWATCVYPDVPNKEACKNAGCYWFDDDSDSPYPCFCSAEEECKNYGTWTIMTMCADEPGNFYSNGMTEKSFDKTTCDVTGWTGYSSFKEKLDEVASTCCEGDATSPGGPPASCASVTPCACEAPRFDTSSCTETNVSPYAQEVCQPKVKHLDNLKCSQYMGSDQNRRLAMTIPMGTSQHAEAPRRLSAEECYCGMVTYRACLEPCSQFTAGKKLIEYFDSAMKSMGPKIATTTCESDAPTTTSDAESLSAMKALAVTAIVIAYLVELAEPVSM